MRSVLLLLALTTSLFAQSATVEVSQRPITYFSARSATIEQDTDGVLIFAEKLFSEAKYAVELEVTKGSAKWASVHDQGKPFPPSVIAEWKPGKFLVKGNPSQVFYVLLGGGDDSIPTWVEVTLPGKPPPPTQPPPPTNPPPPSTDMEQLSLSKAQALNDKETAVLIAKSLDNALNQITNQCNSGQCPTLPGAKQIVVNGIESALAMRFDAFKADWLNGWRKPVNEAVNAKNPVNVQTYVALMRSVQIGLTKVQ